MKSRPFDVVILSSVEWDATWQRHHAFAAQWAKAGHRVFFVENTGFREPGLRDLGRVASRLRRAVRRGRSRRVAAPVGISVVSPLVLPPTRRLFREANASLLAPRLVDMLHDRGLRRGPVVFAYLPTATTLAILDQLAPSLVVYDCVDNFYGLPSPPPNLAETEAALMAHAGLVLTTSRTLYDDKKGLHPRVVEMHHGVGPEFFLPPRPAGPVRRLCYFGTLWRAVDYAPVKALARAGFEVDLIGPVKEEPPPLPATVRFRGRVGHGELPGMLAGYDALLLPYVDDEYNRGVIPAKTYECLATGLPVLASPLPALSGLSGALTICRTPKDWIAAARAASDEPASARAARVAVARAHAEDAVFAELTALVADARERAEPTPAPARRRGALLSGLGWIGALYTAARASTLFTQLLAGRLLGPEEYGRANLAIAAAAYLQIIPMLGFPLATSKLIAEEHDEDRRARLVSTALISFTVWAVATLPVTAALHHTLQKAVGLPSGLFQLSMLLALSTALSQVVASPLLGLKRFAHRGLAETVYGFSAPLLLLALIAMFGAGHRAMVLAFCGSLLASSAYALWTLRHYLRPVIDLGFIRSMAEYAATATVTLLSTACVLAPARLFLNRHATPHEVGLFSAYFTATVQVALAFLYMLQAVLIPMASGADGQRDLWKLFRRWSAPAVVGAWLFFATTAVGGLALFGSRYNFDAGWAAAFAGAAAMILLHGAASSLYAARDLSGLRVSVSGALAAGLGNVALTALLVPRYGVLGAALALIASFSAGLALYGLFALWERRTA
ncbi:MAG: oligosaccharide flippase family protein [Elusimicrobia bacterium]|nr:oligosaccharide flippase family protein [Elusimicrobiota bacterium]